MDETAGRVQIVVSVGVTGLIVMSAGAIAGFLAGRPVWAPVQRWLMDCVLAGLALRMAAGFRP